MAELRHGFTTKEEWKQYFDLYFEKIEEIEQLMLVTNEGDDFYLWLNAYEERSKSIRQMYLNNDNYLDQHIYYFLNDPVRWEENVSDALLAYLFRYCTRFQDIEAAFKIASSLLEFYEQRHHEIAVMKCCYVLVTCYTFLDAVHFKSTILKLCKKGTILYRKHYQELSEEERSLGLSIYDFEGIAMYEFIRTGKEISETFDDILYPAFCERIEVITTFIESADLNLEINDIVPFMKKSWINIFTSLIAKADKGAITPNVVHILYELAYQQASETEGRSQIGQIIDQSIVFICEYHLGIQDTDSLYEFMMAKIDELPDRKVISAIEFNEESFNALTLYTNVIDHIDVSIEKKRYAAHVLLQRMSKSCNMRQKSNFLEHIIDLAIYNYVVYMLKYCSDEETMLKELIWFTVLRQTQTAVHTIMVCKLACCIITSMIEEFPNLVADKLRVSIQQIKNHKEKIIDYVRNAALLHDTGKILCTNVINMQYRKLIPIEFETIQFHPITSGEILKAIPLLAKYHDIAIGHHKSYLGTYGYPASFDPLLSKDKFIIDLITICDTIDAATDNLGRNYSNTKTLYTVLEEVYEERGTRYSPEIIAFLIDHPNLQKELSQLLMPGRKESYRFIYDMLSEQE